MARKEFVYRGKTIEELKELSINEFMVLLPARQRRSIKRGLSERQQKFLVKLKSAGKDKLVKTHSRDMIILPVMVGRVIGVHTGKSFERLEIKPAMLGHYLGEYVFTRKRVTHGTPGIGATRSSMFVSVK